MTATITYRKTKTGEWVAFGPASSIGPGATVTVTKRDGRTKSETIARVGKTFVVNGQQMVYGYLGTAQAVEAPAPRRGALARNLAHQQHRTTRPATSTGGTCDECGRHARALHAAADMSGIAGRVCGRCYSDGDLSFC